MTPIQRPMWCDNFDMDLPKALPEAPEIVGDLGNILLWTSGNADKNGMLNHPSVWHHELGLVAFFGFSEVAKPENYIGRGYVRCTVWEALRDAWAHSFVMLIERRPIWDTQATWEDFQQIMWAMRGWGDQPPPDTTRATARATNSLRKAVAKLRAMVPEFEGRIERLEHEGLRK